MRIKEFIKRIIFTSGLLKCRFNNPKCLARHNCICGKGGSSAPAPVDPMQQYQTNLQAKQSLDPQAAALEFGIQSQYAPQLSDLYSRIREQQLPGGANLNSQLINAITQQLISPTAMTPDQEAATNAIRNREIARAQEAMKTSQNIGGTLYGGRSAASRADDIARMTQGYEATDYDRLLAQQQNAANLALALMSQYLGQSIPTLNYTSPVASSESQLSAATANRGQDLQYQMQQEANKNALYQSLFGAVGQMGAAALAPATGGASLLPMISKGTQPGQVGYGALRY